MNQEERKINKARIFYEIEKDFEDDANTKAIVNSQLFQSWKQSRMERFELENRGNLMIIFRTKSDAEIVLIEAKRLCKKEENYWDINVDWFFY